jgi:arsenate reductase
VTMKPALELPGPVRGRIVEWEFANPDEWDLAGVRTMRDAVAASVRGLVEELSAAPR